MNQPPEKPDPLGPPPSVPPRPPQGAPQGAPAPQGVPQGTPPPGTPPTPLDAPRNDNFGAEPTPLSPFYQESEIDHTLIPDKPIVPTSNKTEGADWNSQEKQSFLDENEIKKAIYSEQSKQAIKMIAAGLDDDDCTQIDAYGPGKFSAQYKGHQTLMEGVAFASHDEYELWVKSMVDNANRLVDWDTIQNDAQGTLALPGGQRLQIFMPPITSSLVFSLRKHTASSWPNEKFVQLRMLDQRILGFLQACIAAKTNVLFVGPMGSGKSSLMRALIASSVGEDEKIAVLESIPELALEKKLVVPMLYQDNIEQMKLDKVLDSNLYFGLSRLIVGEIHMHGLANMLTSMILTDGSMSTYHASSAELAAERMKIALQMEYANLNDKTAASYIRNAIELVVVTKNIDGIRRVTQVMEIDWRKSGGDDVLGGRDIFTYERETDKFRAQSAPDETGRIAEKISNTPMKTFPSEWFVEADFLKKHLKQ